MGEQCVLSFPSPEGIIASGLHLLNVKRYALFFIFVFIDDFLVAGVSVLDALPLANFFISLRGLQA